ncbi:hypothetical protein [Pseudomonas viridiflava]|uniref:hypothetical protein n=1 Tax=Pseudomonas viridiflava TaxID=33069 RepID=UPI0018E637BB|nr:hypothetical protein [Pseudomonas viridiflava]MBI6703048.1 hypothetical protein [Pseudomonas viridiflava]MBI6722071.1 hypothetical protein [Pseudomonas viridiflava]
MKDEVHCSAKQALKDGIMDAEIYDSELVEAFGSKTKHSIARFVDVPIKSVIALQPRVFYAPESSWRDAVQGLSCDGWATCRDKIVDYFTSDLKDNYFPPYDSKGELRIGFTGGAAYCLLGNHRMAAAKAWLAANYGEEAVLKKAKCYYYEISPPLKALMLECLEKGYALKYAHRPTTDDKLPEHLDHNIVKVEKALCRFDIYKLDTQKDSLACIKPSPNPLSRLFRMDTRSKYSRRKFQEVPATLLQKMLDDGEAIKMFEDSNCKPE